MAIFAILGVLLVAILVVIQIFFLIQLTEVGIHVLNPSAGGFMDTGNFFAWIVVFALMAILAAIVRFVFKWVNALGAMALGGILMVFSRRSSEDSYLTRVSISSVLIWLFWLIACLYLTAGVLEHFALNPQLNSWLADGDWMAHLLVYFGIFGLVCPSSESED